MEFDFPHMVTLRTESGDIVVQLDVLATIRRDGKGFEVLSIQVDDGPMIGDPWKPDANVSNMEVAVWEQVQEDFDKDPETQGRAAFVMGELA